MMEIHVLEGLYLKKVLSTEFGFGIELDYWPPDSVSETKKIICLE